MTKSVTVTIAIYNQLGRQVDRIEMIQQKGKNKIEWAPKNLAAGIYHFRMEAGEQVISGKVVMIR